MLFIQNLLFEYSIVRIYQLLTFDLIGLCCELFVFGFRINT